MTPVRLRAAGAGRCCPVAPMSPLCGPVSGGVAACCRAWEGPSCHGAYRGISGSCRPGSRLTPWCSACSAAAQETLATRRPPVGGTAPGGAAGFPAAPVQLRCPDGGAHCGRHGWAGASAPRPDHTAGGLRWKFGQPFLSLDDAQACPATRMALPFRQELSPAACAGWAARLSAVSAQSKTSVSAGYPGGAAEGEKCMNKNYLIWGPRGVGKSTSSAVWRPCFQDRCRGLSPSA